MHAQLTLHQGVPRGSIQRSRSSFWTTYVQLTSDSADCCATHHPRSPKSPAHMDLMKEEVARVRKSTSHLERSNVELKAELELSGPDPVLKQALEENIVIVAKQRARIAALEEEIGRLGGGTSAGSQLDAAGPSGVKLLAEGAGASRQQAGEASVNAGVSGPGMMGHGEEPAEQQATHGGAGSGSGGAAGGSGGEGVWL